MPAVTVMIKPASALCNLRCKYCFYADVAEHRSTRSFGMMSDFTAEALVKGVFDYADRDVSFVFQGGEPTLAGLPFFLRFGELVSRYNAHSLPVHYSLQTNGTTLDGAWADFFKENNMNYKIFDDLYKSEFKDINDMAKNGALKMFCLAQSEAK